MFLSIRYITFILVLILLFGSNVRAQGYGANFSVNSEKGCHSFTVVVTDLSGAPDSIPINYDWGDGSPLDSGEIHTYSQTGIYQIVQTVANGTPRQKSISIEITDNPGPVYSIYNCKNAVSSIQLKDDYYEAYYIDWGDGNTGIYPPKSINSHNYGVINTFNVTVKGLINGTQNINDSSNYRCAQTLKQLTTNNVIPPASLNAVTVVDTDDMAGKIRLNYSLNPGIGYLLEMRRQNDAAFSVLDTIDQETDPLTYTIENLNTANNYYEFSITIFDPCDGSRDPSNIGSSIKLSVNPENQQNNLTWESNSSDFLRYNIYKNNALLTTLNSQNPSEYLDTVVICGSEYSYVVQMEESGGFISVSDTVSVVAVSNEIPPAITNINADVSDKNILLDWETPPGSTIAGFVISRSLNGTTYTTLDTIADTQYEDNNLFTQSTQYFYKINYFDVCNIASEESIIVSPVVLVVGPDKSINWTVYQGWDNGVSSYILEKYDSDGNLIERLPMATGSSYTEEMEANPYQNIIYRIIAVPNNSMNKQVHSNFAKIIFKSRVAFPNAFTPNGDGLNDTFNFEGRYIRSVKLTIFNRWGELIFQTTEIDRGWDGYINGKLAPLGTYIYHAELTDDMGISFIKTGEIVLIR